MKDTPSGFLHKFAPGLRERLDAYIEGENQRNAPARLTIRAAINEAIRYWLDARQASDSEEAA